jgi:hypothetical protein
MILSLAFDQNGEESAMDSWIAVLQALATPAIAVGGAFIAFAQLRIAQRRAAFDLFERRLTVYEELQRAAMAVIGSAKVDQSALMRVSQAQFSAKFIFGKDVNTYLEKMHNDFVWRFTHTDEAIDAHPNRDELLNLESNILLRITAFKDTAPPLFARYMRMDQKVPSRWLGWPWSDCGGA